MGKAESVNTEPGTSTLDLALRLVEYLAYQSGPTPLGTIAAAFDASKSTVYRHLQTLQRHGFVRHDPATGSYDIGVKMMVLGEASRSRFDIVTTARPELLALRDATGQAVTICTLIDDEVVVLELTQGRTVIEFATRPGTRMALHASAHGKVWLAFGPDHLLDKVASAPLQSWTPDTITDPKRLIRDVKEARTRGWTTAPDEVISGVNTLAAPVRNHHGTLIASIAIVGAKQFIPATPTPAQITATLETAARISGTLGWRQ
ncbi:MULTISPECIES: IclR family transcriptional regulator [unclassified Beijerinckia]|uniref:IclR family transcriptional regulator n=1 Tax=unclassified Beijerinckia TaxID=2638183 RepID=UPI0008990DDB|nr:MULTISPECIES: IclR family transcriptional regulator [unclassified Beijerinckia]MDH7794950.1 DNA-binding IclR family transcriptional regulator [Beijerinckia sp. GAS462]SEB81632.1 transcriptional regulator, IclR family [Beijerinckia sp. 28-YEA-48]